MPYRTRAALASARRATSPGAATERSLFLVRGRLGSSSRLGQVHQGPPPAIGWAQGASAVAPLFVIENQGSPVWQPGAIAFLWRAPATVADVLNVPSAWQVANTYTLTPTDIAAGAVAIADPNALGEPSAYQYWGAIHSADGSAVSGSGTPIPGASLPLPGATSTSGASGAPLAAGFSLNTLLFLALGAVGVYLVATT